MIRWGILRTDWLARRLRLCHFEGGPALYRLLGIVIVFDRRGESKILVDALASAPDEQYHGTKTCMPFSNPVRDTRVKAGAMTSER